MQERDSVNSFELRRQEYKRLINAALEKPGDSTKHTLAFVQGETLTEESGVVLKGFSLEEARVFLEEVRRVLEELIDSGEHVISATVAELRPHLYLEMLKKIGMIPIVLILKAFSYQSKISWNMRCHTFRRLLF